MAAIIEDDLDKELESETSVFEWELEAEGVDETDYPVLLCTVY